MPRWPRLGLGAALDHRLSSACSQGPPATKKAAERKNNRLDRGDAELFPQEQRVALDCVHFNVQDSAVHFANSRSGRPA